MNTQTDDELLSAYLDGELDAVEADRLTERLAEDPRLMRRLEAMRRADSAVGDVYRDIDRKAMPDSVLELFDTAGNTPQHEKRGNVVAFPARGIRRFFEPQVAIAAGVALAVGILVAGLFGGGAPQVGDGLVAGTVRDGSTLEAVLETGPSGEALRLGDQTDATVILSFRDTQGDFCRQLRVDGESRPVHGLACRRDGQWQLEALALGAAGSGDYSQASSEVPAALRLAVDERIGAGDILDPEEENAYISEGWK